LRAQQRWSRAGCGASRTLGSQREITFQTQSPARHGSQNLCSAFVTAVVHINELAARERDELAHFHERLAPWAWRRRHFQAGPWFILDFTMRAPQRVTTNISDRTVEAGIFR